MAHIFFLFSVILFFPPPPLSSQATLHENIQILEVRKNELSILYSTINMILTYDTHKHTSAQPQYVRRAHFYYYYPVETRTRVYTKDENNERSS